MADSLSLDMKFSLQWLFQDVLALGAVSDAARLEYVGSLTDGVGVDQADNLWHDQQIVTGGGANLLDLTALSRPLFGGAVTVNFTKIKALLIVNTATTAGDDLAIGGAGAVGKGWGAPFDGDPDARLLVPADSAVSLVNKKNGWSVVNDSSDILRIENTSLNDVTYRIAMIGVSS